MLALVVWSLFYFFVVRTLLTNVPLTRVDLLSFVLDGRPYTHLYFLWLIVGLYVVAPVLAAFLRDAPPRRAITFAGIVLAATVVTAMSSSIMGSFGAARPLALLALTQWLPYVGFFLAGWALRNVRLGGWRLVAAAAATVAMLGAVIVQYASRPSVPVLDAVFPGSYFGPLVSAASLGVSVCMNSALAYWRPGPRTARGVTELSDAAFSVFLVHFALMILVHLLQPLAGADASFLLSLLEWIVVVIVSFVIVMVMRRIPGVRRLV